MFLDRSWVVARLQVMDSYAEGLREVKRRGKPAFEADPLSRLAAERGLHVCIECVVDVCSHIIDGYAMRDPTSYSDMLRIMMEEGVFDQLWGETFLPAADLRARLVREYDRLTPDEVWDAVVRYTDMFSEANDQFRKFLRIS
ncbi:MAG: DUF86 domain-containing protein [Kyrpidia sp.]|nr:DUF86 domain-containing protein [Kyrpidia sp.]